jgi:lipopolysaccharide transport system permease protein
MIQRPVSIPAAQLSDQTSGFTLRVQPTKGFGGLDLAALWEFRELLYFLVWRDISVRYKQTLMGAAWTVLQPLLTMVVFTVIFGAFAKIPSDGLPYSIFTFAALVPWTYFSQAISRSGVSLVSDSQLVKKVYFPRLIIPLASAASPLMDFLVSFVVLLLMMAWFHIPLHAGLLTLPFFLLVTVMTATAVSLWLAPLNARYRDIGYTIPFLTQFWFYASPVTYPLSLIPEKWRLLYGLNPMAGVIEGFRWALLGKRTLDLEVVGLSVVVATVLLVTGMVFFKRMERTLADVL